VPVQSDPPQLVLGTVQLMVVLPADAAVTSPFWSMVAAEVLELAHWQENVTSPPLVVLLIT
jgi:hypothetical protein